MRYIRIKLIATIIAAGIALHTDASVNVGTGKTEPVVTNANKTLVADCPAAESQFDLAINNVRTRLLNGGDLWWDLSNARYEIPKIDPPGSAPSVHALFAGAIWISGLDEGGNLKLAAQTYRQGGDDFWPGPIDDAGNVNSETCEVYDKHFNVLGSEIDVTRAAFVNNGMQPISASAIPENVLKWPGIGNPHLLADGIDITSPLAPFFDFNDDGRYDPTFGDYPVIDGDPDCEPQEFTYGDQMIFWVYNDVGNIHSETGGEAIGIQVNALAFAFQTSDEINDMTFYRYNVVNRSSATLTQTYMGQWVDPDLGCFNDDYVGCDTSRSLGIVYNGDNFDEDCQSLGYGNEIPMLGVDYFESPRDTSGLELGMSSFIYYNNDFTGQGNPTSAAQFRNYQTGFWRDGSLVECGGDAYQENTGPCPYMFPDDPSNPAGWSECLIGTVPADRRFIQNSGPFVLLPGSQNFITVGAVFVKQPPGFQSLCAANFDLLRSADDKAQALFDNCFKLVDGPDAPTLEIRELDKEIIITLVNEATSNNVNESYDQVDPLILIEDPTAEDSTYTFQGYRVFQLASQTVSTQDLDDPTKAKLVFQADIKDGVDKIINFEFDQFSQAEIPTTIITSPDEGIRHSFRITEDAFASDNPKLVNHETYYFAAIAYAYNNYAPFDPQNPLNGGQKTPYLQGRRNFNVYSAIPHIPDARNNGTRLNSEYGQGLEVKRVEGQGNGGLELRITETSENSILSSPTSRYDTVTYQPNFGPVQVKVVDPFLVKEANFELKFIENDTAAGDVLSNSATWELRDLTNNRTIFSDRPIDRPNEQIIVWDDPDSDIDVEYGISVSVGQPVQVYTNARNDEPVFDYINSEIIWEDPTRQWLAAIQDVDGNSFENWIRSGELFLEDGIFAFVFNDFSDELTPPPPGMTMFHDPDEKFESILDGVFAPYCLGANWADEVTAGQFFPFAHGPGFKWQRYNLNRNSENTLDELQSVLIVLTPDKEKWTRSVVIETGENFRLNNKFTRNGQIKPNFNLGLDGQPSSPVSTTTINPGETYLAVGPNGFQLSYTDSLGGTRTVRDHPTSTQNYDGHVGFTASDITASTNLTLDNGVIVYNAKDIGLSYFPGYAINLENGERLNVCFGESSGLPDQNGDDMIWNPTGELRSPVNSVLNGGKHNIYIMKTLYDEGAAQQAVMVANYNSYLDVSTFEIPTAMREIYRQMMYTSMPFLAPGFTLNSVADGIVPTEVKAYINVARPYKTYGTQATSTDSLPRYLFGTQGLAPEEQVAEVADSALDLINVVPNPYYAYSTYETSQLDNRVKITNLPNECTVTIFSVNGQLIRRYNRAVDTNIDISKGNSTEIANLDNSLDWDLKNFVGIPISSGLYLIHVEAPGIGERTIKWFGALRPTDLDSF